MGNGPRYPIERFDALLRNLITWGLVGEEKTEDGSSWQLVDAAQRRLDELNRSSHPLVAEALIYLDRRCADCNLRSLTHLHEGSYLCDACWAVRCQVPEGSSSPEAPSAEAPASRRRRFRRGRGQPEVVASASVATLGPVVGVASVPGSSTTTPVPTLVSSDSSTDAAEVIDEPAPVPAPVSPIRQIATGPFRRGDDLKLSD